MLWLVWATSVVAWGQGRPLSPRELANVMAARDVRQRLEAGDPQGVAAVKAQIRSREGSPPPFVPSLPLPTRPPTGAERRAAILQAIANGQDPALYEIALEELVARDPLDREARSWLLVLAERRGDQVAALRHRAHLPQPRENFPWWKWIISGLLSGLVVWQAAELWRDWQHLDRISGTASGQSR